MRRRYIKPPPNQGFGRDLFIKPKVQTKLTIGKSDDKYEVEADKMADQVVNKTDGNNAVQKKDGEEEVQQKPLVDTVTPLIQKMESNEDEGTLQRMEEEEAVQMEQEEELQTMEEEESVQLKSDGKNIKRSSVENKLKNSSLGSKIDPKTLLEMEEKFGTKFNHIRIHDDNVAAQMCQDIGAQAFTRGYDIYFNAGKYNPNSTVGKRLLAHELTHTIQQGKVKEIK